MRIFFPPPLLGPEEECFVFLGVIKAGNVKRAAECVAEIVFFVRRPVDIKKAPGIEDLVAIEFVNRAVNLLVPDLVTARMVPEASSPYCAP